MIQLYIILFEILPDPIFSTFYLSLVQYIRYFQRISVFEPYPMRDTIQHFCEKHLDTIKAYMENVSAHIPPPAKCTVEGKYLTLIFLLHNNVRTAPQLASIKSLSKVNDEVTFNENLYGSFPLIRRI